MTLLETTKTHQSEFTRGYWLGFARATTLYWRGAFHIDLPAEFLDDLREVVEPRSVLVRGTERKQYGVEFASVHVGPTEVLVVTDDRHGTITLVAG